VTKLNSHEENYLCRVINARDNELRYLRQELAVWAMTLVLIVISPMLATAATFAVYVLIDESNILTASRAFSVLLLFSALRFPINNAGRLIGSMLLEPIRLTIGSLHQ
jgi:ATP-binding cassette subfamily C (CFTR/MRP) protein 1